MAGYWTQYRYQLNDRPEKHTGNSACFAEIYSYFAYSNDGFIRVGVNRDKKLYTNMYKDNYCILSDDEINEYFEWMRKVTGMDITISNEIDESIKQAFTGSESFFVANINLSRNTMFECKFILALLRNIYEGIFRTNTKVAFLSKDIKELSGLDLSERIVLAYNTLGGGGGHTIHLFDSILHSDDDLIKLFKSKKNSTNIQPFYVEVPNSRSKNSELRARWGAIGDTQRCLESGGNLSKDIKDVLISNYDKLKK